MRQKIPQLDAVRGIAILLVLLHNAGGKYPSLKLDFIFGNGWMGVDLFFVLSGFLITGILLDSRGARSYFQNFYARRVLRIWPLYYAVLVAMFVVVPLIRPTEAPAIFLESSPWWSYPLFLQNFLVKHSSLAVGPLGVSWSLAIEEQFYIFWPVLVRFCSLTQLRRLTIAVVCLSPLIRYYLSFHGVALYTNLFCRLDGLMAGAFLAVLAASPLFVPVLYCRRAWITLLVALPLAFLAEGYQLTPLVFSCAALASAAFTYLAMFSPQKWLQFLLRNRFLVYTGTISYGLYLLHRLPMDAAQTFHLDRYPLPTFLLATAASYILAALSWKFLETPFLKLKHYFEFVPSASLSSAPVLAPAPRAHGLR